MINPDTMRSQARRQFDTWAHSYDRSVLNHFLFRPAYMKFLEHIHAWRKDRPEPFDVLDIGCGTGTFGAMLAMSALPVRVTGLDYAPAMCRVASGKAAEAGLDDRLRFIAADSQHLPFADASFDVITCSNSFHHYPDQQAVVRDMRRVLRGGGRLMLIDGFRDNIVGWVTFDVIIGKVEKHVFHAPWSTVDSYFREAGFVDIHREKLNFFFPLLLTVGTAPPD